MNEIKENVMRQLMTVKENFADSIEKQNLCWNKCEEEYFETKSTTVTF